ncbi:MAG: transglutaminase domain-containing protein [Candidatus Fermentibacteraceae bacterium]
MSGIILACMVTLSPGAEAEVDSLLAETQGNAEMWSDYLAEAGGDTLECALYLLRKVPRLDRLEMTPEALDDHILGALAHRGSMPDSVFLECLLWYRVSREPVTAYRERLAAFWTHRGVEGPEDLSRWMAANLDTIPREFLGGMQPPAGVLESGAGTGAELQVLLVASLRSLGWPARVVKGWFAGPEGGERSWAEVWMEGEWQAVDPPGMEGLVLAVEESHGIPLTSEHVSTGSLVTVPPQWEGDFRISLSLPVRGRWLPLDWAVPAAEGPDTLVLGEGELLVMLTRRLPAGGVGVWHRFVQVEAGTTVPVDFSAI